MTHWNCRVIKYAEEDGEYGTHEVFYDDAGAIVGWTEAPSLALMAPQPELIREQVLAMIDDALRQPVLFENELPRVRMAAGATQQLVDAELLSSKPQTGADYRTHVPPTLAIEHGRLVVKVVHENTSITAEIGDGAWFFGRLVELLVNPALRTAAAVRDIVSKND